MTPREQDDLVQLILDGQADQDDIATFQKFFREDAGFRQRYYDHTTLADYLESTFRPDRAKEGRQDNGRPARRKILPFAVKWTAVAAVLLLLSVAAFLLTGVRDKSAAGKLAFSAGSRWSVQAANSASASGELTLSPGDVLELQQGVARISFDSGVQAVVSGACRLYYPEAGRFQLEHGTVWFDISEQALGSLVITTPRMRIVNHGTQFGVIASRQGTDEVHVLNGRVESEGLRGGRVRAVVNAGRAVAFNDAGEVHEQRNDANGFVKKLPDELPYVHWSFDELVGGKFPTSGKFPALTDAHAEYRSPESTPSDQRVVSGVFGNAVKFKQAGDLVVTPYAGISGSGPRSMAFWMRMPPDQAEEQRSIGWTGLLGWGRRHYPDMNFTESIHAIVGQAQLQGPDVKTRVPILSFERIWFEGTTNLFDGKWHHLVWTYSGGTRSGGLPDVMCYCDGRPETLRVGGYMNFTSSEMRALKINTVVDDDKSVPVILGGSLLSIEDTESLFPGEMDEVYVIEGVVTQTAARRLFLENRFVPETATNTAGE